MHLLFVVKEIDNEPQGILLISSVLKEAGLLETCDSSFDREPAPAKGSRRFEAQYPGELWQMDVTYVYIRKIPVLYLVVIIDDHSRFCVGAVLCRDQRADTLIGVLHNACTAYGVPKKLLTDQGSGFYSWSREQTQFQEYLDDLPAFCIFQFPDLVGQLDHFARFDINVLAGGRFIMDHTTHLSLIARHHRNHRPAIPVSGSRIGIHPAFPLSLIHHMVQLFGYRPLLFLLAPADLVQSG